MINGETFKTSIDVLKDVMGIPASVIKNELRKHNYNVSDTSSNCIDEKMLERFELLYRKNLKKYFLSSVENLDKLTKEEYDDFVEFSKAFSKDGELTFNWRKIDKSVIREKFFYQVKEETNRKYLFKISDDEINQLLQYLAAVISRSVPSLPVFDASVVLTDSLDNFNLKNDTNQYVDHLSNYKSFKDQTAILRNVVKSRLYKSTIQAKQKHRVSYSQPIIFYACLRLHIVPDDGTSDGYNKLRLAQVS
jgi:hypothetical protein